MAIHPSAIVHPGARVAPDAEIGPYAVIGDKVVIGARTSVGAHTTIDGPTAIGDENRISPHVALGGAPQDLKYKGEETRLVIGHRNVLREFMTAHRGTVTGHAETVIGDENLFMAYTHVAHDCVVGNRTVFANGASLAGHSVIEDDVILGAFAAVKQFCRVGRYAFVGAFAQLNKDVLPFVWTSSERATKAWKVNSVGLSRKGFSDERVLALQKAYRVLHKHRHDHNAALAELEELAQHSEDVRSLRDFISAAKHGVHGA